MITPLITKLQNCENKCDLQSIYKEILFEYDNIIFPSDEVKAESKILVTESIEVFINNFDSESLREHNKKLLESIKLFDTM